MTAATGTSHELTLAEIAGEMYGALMEARGWVAKLSQPNHPRLAAGAFLAIRATLDRVDAALAEAGEYLAETHVTAPTTEREVTPE